MKKLGLLIAMLTFIVGTSLSQVSFGGGAHSSVAFTSFPKPLNEFFGVGFGWGAHGDLRIIPEVGIRMSFDYNRFASDKAKLKDTWFVTDPFGRRVTDFEVEGSNVTIIGITANVLGKIPTRSSIRPYGVLGLGLQISSISDENLLVNGQTIATRRAPDGSTNFGLSFGAGSEISLGRRTSLFIETRYSLIFASGGNSSYVPITFGVSF